MTSLVRITKENKDLQKNPIPLIKSVGPVSENNYQWQAIIIGPDDSPYEKGHFKLDIFLGNDYPFKPPQIKFLTKVYHPNISNDGEICLDLLKSEWSAALTIGKILISIISLLTDPNPNDPLEYDKAQEFKNNREIFDRKAKEWTLKYATEEQN